MKINIRPLLEKHGISRYELSQKIDVTYPTITAMYNGTSSSIRLDILEKICRELHCTPNDILIFDHKYETNDTMFDAMNPPEQ